MHQLFWQSRWDKLEIGFHEGQPNDLLLRHSPALEVQKGARVLVPLAGKSADLRWLAERGYEVVGVEFVADAIAQFFDEWERVPTPVQRGPFTASVADHVTLVNADMLEVTPEALGSFDLVYDRAALVALEPSTRARYIEVCRKLCAGRTLLLGFAYDQTKLPGPPWSIDEAAVSALFAGRSVRRLEARMTTAGQRFADRGVSEIQETAYLIG